MILVEGAVNRMGVEVGIMSSLTCLLHWLNLIMRVIVRVMTRMRTGIVMMRQGFRGFQLEGLLEEEVMGMKPLSSRMKHLLSRWLLLSSWVGYFPTCRRTTSSLHSYSK